MSQELFCELHGPYPASFGSCPICSGRPAAPRSLGDMEEDTFIGADRAYASASDEEATEIGMGRSNIFGEREEDQTMIAGGPSHTQLERHRSGCEAMLWVNEGSRRGHWYPVYNNTTIGRKKAEIILDDERVSGTHAKITLEKNAYSIWDFGSSNGTFVNGKRIREATILQENDKIKIGDTVFLMKILNAKKKAKPASKASAAKKSTVVKSAASKSKKATAAKS